jgi:hypothetical protein
VRRPDLVSILVYVEYLQYSAAPNRRIYTRNSDYFRGFPFNRFRCFAAKLVKRTFYFFDGTLEWAEINIDLFCF